MTKVPEPRPDEVFTFSVDPETGGIYGALPVPPVGETVAYATHERVGDPPNDLHYILEIPGGVAAVDLTSPIVERDGGSDPEDHAYRERLYRAVGRVTVAGGHVEAALKRTLIVLSPTRNHFWDADLDWRALEVELSKQLKDGGTDKVLANRVRRLLDGADERQLRTQRNHVVHGQWWALEGTGGRLSRWPRREHGWLMHYLVADVEQLGSHLEVYAKGLNNVIRKYWPRAVLPQHEQALRPFMGPTS